MPCQWFVGRTQQGKETWARKNLENQGFETYLPMCIMERAKFPKIKPFLPTYIFIHLDVESGLWGRIHNTMGMKSLLTSGDRPAPLQDWIVQDIKDREKYGFIVLPAKTVCKFKRGDRVMVKGSPLEAIFEEVRDNHRAILFSHLLGRRHEFSVPLSKLTTASVMSTA